MSKAYVFTRNGGPEVEALIDQDVPVPGPGELLVAVRAAGVNPVDWKLRTGYLRPGSAAQAFPTVFGSEAAGVVEGIGPDVEGFAIGDEVFGNPLTGGYAEHTLLPVSVTAHRPAGLSFTDAAVLPVAAATAYDGIRQLGLAPGSTLLITGAGVVSEPRPSSSPGTAASTSSAPRARPRRSSSNRSAPCTSNPAPESPTGCGQRPPTAWTRSSTWSAATP